MEILRYLEKTNPLNHNGLWLLSGHLKEWLHNNVKGWDSIAEKHTACLPEEIREQCATSYNALALVFVFSRDALKAIRPEGWTLHYMTRAVTDGRYLATMRSPGPSLDQYQVVSRPLPTEELAELHAIIQSLEYERGHV